MSKRITALILTIIIILSSFSVYADEDKTITTVPVLLYHAIEEVFPEEISNVAISTETFEEHMRALLQNGYTTITFQDYIDFKYYNKALPEKPIIITFDDGYLSNYTKAYPILKKYGMKATIFMVASLVGKMYPEINYSHFTWAQAREMRESGVIEIGSHTYFHTDVTECTPERVAMDLRLSKYLIDTNLNYDCNLLAFPYGKATHLNEQQALDAGFALACMVGDAGANTEYTPITGLKRLTINGSYSSEVLLDYIDNQVKMELWRMALQEESN